MNKPAKREAKASLELYTEEDDTRPSRRTSKAAKLRRCTDTPEVFPEFSFITCSPSLEANQDAESHQDVAPCCHVQLMSERITSLEGTVNKAVNLVQRLMEEVGLLKNEIKQLRNPQGNVETVTTENKLPQLPFTDVNDFLQFEDELKNAAQFQVLVAYSKSITEYVGNAWRSVLVDNVARQFSWKGTAEKVSVKKLHTTAALENAFRKKFPLELIEIFEKKTKKFFLYANDRMTKFNNYHKRKQTEMESSSIM